MRLFVYSVYTDSGVFVYSVYTDSGVFVYTLYTDSGVFVYSVTFMIFAVVKEICSIVVYGGKV